MNIISLDCLHITDAGIIHKIDINSIKKKYNKNTVNQLTINYALESQLLDMGFIEGSKIQVMNFAGFKRNLIAVRINNSSNLIALRKNDAAAIIIQKL